MTPGELLVTIARLQSMIGEANNAAQNDRDINRAAVTRAILDEAHDLCLLATGGHPPVESARIKRHREKFPVKARSRI